jgi:energy-coupling factor transporter ATP-binding protein EcfA2
VASQLVPGFEIDDFNRELLRLLYAYATRDSYFTEQGYSLDKGLLLYGNVGSGKTGQMKILQRVLNLMHSPLAFAYTTVSAVSDSFGANGFEAFLSYGQRNWMFDELGRLDRETVQYFGNKINVAESLIQNRYELFTRGYLSHFTTNLSKAQMAESYDERVWSRLQEMCNVIRAAAPDRRPNATPKPLLPVVEKKETPAYTDEMKKETILSEARKLQEGAGYLFLDAGGVHFEYLMARGVITTDALADAEAEEMVRLIKNVRSNPPGKLDRAAFLEFEQAEELPPGNKYTKELRYRVEKRVLRETIEQIAKNRLTI